MVAAPIDALVAAQVLRALEPAALEFSLQAGEDMAQERDRLDRYRWQECERARHEANRAELCYRAIDPTNRLVARTLEQRWEESLVRVRQAEEDYHRFAALSPPRPTEHDRMILDGIDVSRVQRFKRYSPPAPTSSRYPSA